MNSRIRIFLLSYLVIGLLALGLGVTLPDTMATLAPYNTIFLGIIFFLSALKINVSQTIDCLRDIPMVIAVVVCMLFVFAGATFFVTEWLAPEFTVAFVLLAAMPVGMTAPLLATISGGRSELAMTLAVVTSLLAPLTIPFVISLFLEAAVSVSFFDMFINLSTIIFMPFLLAQIVRNYVPSFVQQIAPAVTPVSLLSLGLLITGIIAQQVLQVAEGFEFISLTPSLFGVLLLFIIFHIVGLSVVFWHSMTDRVTISICLTYMNFSLAVYLASEFFADGAVTLTLVVAIIPWVLLLPVFRLLTIRFLQS